jgi:ABC-type sugar transport system ATPase subunit/carboxylesterase type B/ABC-type glycerol-3-phosphate transport system substrate-binding protein
MTEVIARTSAGQLRGAESDGIVSFKGVPYAAPPIERRRFRPPQPVTPWDGVRDALTLGPSCPQPSQRPPGWTQEHALDEDCLYLNVWTPALDAAKRPVMFWIHGGGYAIGSGSWPLYDGEALSRRGDVVVVTVNHRLGALGYLHLAEIAGEEFVASGNNGMLDLVQALEWVRDNAESFGGDADNVTVFGESGGGAKISTLLAMPSARGLFHRAVIQSGPGLRVTSERRATEAARNLLSELDVTAENLSALWDLPAERFVGTGGGAMGRMGFSPVLDGTVIPAHPAVALADGSAIDVPLMIGCNRDEGAGMLPSELDDAGLRERLSSYGADHVEEIIATYTELFPDASNVEILSFVTTDARMRYGSIQLAQAKLAGTASPTFMYFFTYELGGRAGTRIRDRLPLRQRLGRVRPYLARPRASGRRDERSMAGLRPRWRSRARRARQVAVVHGARTGDDGVPARRKRGRKRPVRPGSRTVGAAPRPTDLTGGKSRDLRLYPSLLEMHEYHHCQPASSGRWPRMAQIVLEDVWKVFADGTEAVRAVDLDIADGEFIVLVGPSGCGKTTVLRMIAGLETISKGEVRIGDRVVNDVPPKERDIAMVFQNYALYPHMSVFDNMAFGLKLQKLPKDEIEQRVHEAASILDMESLLERKPAALSGGQRQRVAMGRAIVRHPQAFLMDEPLSNLDAKLRVQMRSEISRLQDELGVTTIYVTHDQVEAMTMGDRVAVIRKGELQQVDAPETLYERPDNLFVAGFIGSPAMNLLEATIEASGDQLTVVLGSNRLAVPDDVLADRPRLRDYVGRTLVLGIRPEDMEDASLVADAPPERRITTEIGLREALGSDVVVHFDLDAAPALTEDVRELAVDVSRDALERVERQAGTNSTETLARLNPRTTARAGDRVELVVDTHRLHYFDFDDGQAIYGGRASECGARPGPYPGTAHNPTNKGRDMRLRRLMVPLVVLVLLAAACGDDDDNGNGAEAPSGDDTGSVNLLTALDETEAVFIREIFDDLIHGDVEYSVEVEASGNFEEQFQIRAQGGTLDIAAVPQPGAIPDLVERGEIVALEDLGFDIGELNDMFGEGFVALGEYQGKHYGLPTNINLKSMIWYPKAAFDDAGYEIPETWDDLIALSDQIVADGSAPWCIGIESEGATGWPATDWIEDIMLATAGVDVYDQWYRNEIPFTDDAVRNAFELFGEILFTDGYVLGGASNVADVAFGDAPGPMFQDPPGCYLHRQASFINAFFPEGTEAGVDYDWFPFPSIDQQGTLYAGELTVVGRNGNRPEVVDFLRRFMGQDVQCAMAGVEGSSRISPNVEVGRDCYANEILAGAAEVLTEALAEDYGRFDASDLMPASVGSGSFWTGMVEYVRGGPGNLDEVLESIQAGWE